MCKSSLLKIEERLGELEDRLGMWKKRQIQEHSCNNNGEDCKVAKSQKHIT
jgi:hypothetical protein